jgi:hypothetical protein
MSKLSAFGFGFKPSPETLKKNGFRFGIQALARALGRPCARQVRRLALTTFADEVVVRRAPTGCLESAAVVAAALLPLASPLVLDNFAE